MYNMHNTIYRLIIAQSGNLPHVSSKTASPAFQSPVYQRRTQTSCAAVAPRSASSAEDRL